MLIKYAYDEYKNVTIDRQRIQFGYLRNYLWLATVLIGAQGTLFFKYFESNGATQPFWAFLVILISGTVAIFSSLAAFILGVDTLRGRKNTILPFGDFLQLGDMSHAMASTLNTTQLRSCVLSRLNEAISVHVERAHGIGIKLRRMSVLIIMSTCVTISGTIGIAYLKN